MLVVDSAATSPASCINTLGAMAGGIPSTTVAPSLPHHPLLRISNRQYPCGAAGLRWGVAGRWRGLHVTAVFQEELAEEEKN